MKVDSHIIRAINQYVAANNTTRRDFAAQLGVSETAMVKWNKEGKGIADENWERMFPLIKRYLPKDRFYITNSGKEEYSSLTECRKPLYATVFIPLLSTADLLRYDSVVNVERFARDEGLTRVEYKPRVANVGGMFAYDLQQAFIGVPAGATLYVSSEVKPHSDALVLAATVNREVVLGMYSLGAGGTYVLNTGDRTFSGKIEDIRRIFTAFFPVIHYEVVCY